MFVGVDRVDKFHFYGGDPSRKNEISNLVEDLKFSLEPLFNQTWSSEELIQVKELAKRIVDHTAQIQEEFPSFSLEHEILNRIRDKIQDFIINPIMGLLNPGSTESNPKELWDAIESAFFGPWSLYQELKLLDSNIY